MSFLAIIVLLAMLEFSALVSFLQQDKWLFSWRALLLAKLDQSTEAFLFVYLIVPICVVFIVNQAILGGELEFFQWLFQIAVLAWCLGRGNFQEAVDKYMGLWKDGDIQGSYHMLRETNALPEAADASHAGVVHANARAVLLYNGFERLFVVLFWYSLLGVEVCLAYRMLRLHQQHSQNVDPDKMIKTKQWIYSLEWLPVRAIALAFAFIGNFTQVIQDLKEVLFSVKESTIQNINRFALAALGFSMNCLEDKMATDESQKTVFREIAIFELNELRALLKRSLFVWVVALAIWQLLI